MDRVFDLKVALRESTTVPEERQKILGLVKGKLPPDQVRMYVPCSRLLWTCWSFCAGDADCLGVEEISISSTGRSLRLSEPLKGTKSKIRTVCLKSAVGLR